MKKTVDFLVSLYRDLKIRFGVAGLFLLASATVLLVAYRPLVDKVTAHAARVLNGCFQNTLATKATTIAFMLFAMYVIVGRYWKKLPSTAIITSVYVLLFVSYVRCAGIVEWEYIIPGKIAYIDMPLILSVLVIALYVIERCRIQLVNHPAGRTDKLLFDDPITDDAEDILGRMPFVKEFVNKIMACDTKQSAYSIGVVAPWGCGKTSFLNLFVKELAARSDSRFKIMHFSPWRFSEKTDITLAFFKQLLKQVSNEDETLFRLIDNYAKWIVGESVASRIAPLRNEQQPEELFERISTILSARDERIVVIIDDMDRLDGKEILEVLKIIRGSANFPNLIFVAAYDKEYVVKAVCNVQNVENERFVEKFFQAELYLPLYSTEKIERFILDKAGEFLAADDYAQFKENYIEYKGIVVTEQPYKDFIRNIRDAKRWINSIKMEYSLLKGEVRICNLADVILLKLYFPALYNLLSYDYETYLHLANGYYVLWNEKHKADKHWTLFNRDKKDLWECDLVKRLSSDDKCRLKRVFARLLPDITSFPESKQFNDPFYTPRYFWGILQETDISDGEFRELVKMEHGELKSRMHPEYIENRKTALLKHWRYFTPVDEKERFNVLRMIFYACNNTQGLFCSQDIVYNLLNGFDMDKEQVAVILRTLMLENGASYYVSLLIKEIKNHFYDWDKIMSDAQFDEIQLKQLELAIDEELPVDEILSFLWITTSKQLKQKGDETYTEYVNDPNAVKILKQGIIAQPSKFLLRLIGTETHPSIEKKEWRPHNLISEAWPDWAEFERFLDTLPSTAQNDEYKDFFNKFKNNNYHAVEYEFKHSAQSV